MNNHFSSPPVPCSNKLSSLVYVLRLRISVRKQLAITALTLSPVLRLVVSMPTTLAGLCWDSELDVAEEESPRSEPVKSKFGSSSGVCAGRFGPRREREGNQGVAWRLGNDP